MTDQPSSAQDRSAAVAHYRKLERVYLRSPTNAYYQPRIHIQEGLASIEIDVRPDYHHAAGAVHGSHYFKLLDDAAFFAANSLVYDVFVLTASFHLHLLRPIAAGRMCSSGRIVRAARQLLIAESELKDEGGNLLAQGSGTFVRSRIALDARIGYAAD